MLVESWGFLRRTDDGLLSLSDSMGRLLDCLSWMLGGWPKISEIKEDTEAGDKAFWMEETSLGDWGGGGGGAGCLWNCSTISEELGMWSS